VLTCLSACRARVHSNEQRAFLRQILRSEAQGRGKTAGKRRGDSSKEPSKAQREEESDQKRAAALVFAFHPFAAEEADGDLTAGGAAASLPVRLRVGPRVEPLQQSHAESVFVLRVDSRGPLAQAATAAAAQGGAGGGGGGAGGGGGHTSEELSRRLESAIFQELLLTEHCTKLIFGFGRVMPVLLRHFGRTSAGKLIAASRTYDPQIGGWVSLLPVAAGRVALSAFTRSFVCCGLCSDAEP
jgi:hypothetical protein